MRVDLMKLSAVALAAALLAPPGVRAQQAAAPAAAPTAQAAPAPVTLSASSATPAPAAAQPGSQISFRGYSVPRGKVVDGDVVVPFGNVRIEGEVMGDVTVGKGDLILAQGGVIHGDAVVNGGGQLLNEGGRVYGEMRVNSADEEDEGDQALSAASASAADEDRGAGGNASEHLTIRHRGGFWGSVSRGIEGIVSTLMFGLILCALGAGLVFFALPQLERVSGTIRRETARAVGVGVAANFLSLPAFVIGLVVLAVTIIGIPLLLLYVPLFWVALAAAAAFGVIAVAHAIGERTAEQSGSFASVRRNAYSYTFTGIALLLAPHLAGHVLELTGFLGWLGGLVEAVGVLVLWLAATVGFGAVVLTRGGTRAGWPWKPREMPYDPIFDEEPAFEGSGARG